MKWEYIVIFLGVIVVNIMMEVTLNEKVSRWIRYLCLGFICLLHMSVIAMVVYLGIQLYHQEPLVALLMCLFGLITSAGVVAYIRALHHRTRSRA